MNYLNMTIGELHALYVSGTVTPLQVIEDVISALSNDENNILEATMYDEARLAAKEIGPVEEGNLLWGIPFLVKDNIAVKDYVTSGSSKILKNFITPFDAAVIKKLRKHKAIPVAKTTLDELSMGGRGTTGHKGVTFNPYDKNKELIVGGSSSGSASGVASGYVPFALGSDTGDSIRKPASYTGLVGFKPTWGKVNREGLFSFMPTFDHLGFFTRSVSDAALLLNVTQEQKDSSDNIENITNDLKGARIAVIKPLLALYKNKALLARFKTLLKELEAKGAVISYVDFDEKLLEAIYPTYLILSCAEATSSNANLTGITFGERSQGESYEEIITKTRSENIGRQAKIRFLIGEFVLRRENYEAYYKNAQKARGLIVTAINKIFENYDFIIAPSAPSVAPKVNDKSENGTEVIENHLAIANFGGYPSITVPLLLTDNLPIGINLTGPVNSDAALLSAAWNIEEITGLYNLHVGWENL
ncbi:MAG TPA: amidase family protein [Bacilli bacterium]|nr:amidase family protein [Bacilli bacterium]